MARLLVTGGAGFIGSNFVHYWLRQHPQDVVIVLDALSYAGNLANLVACESNPQFSFVKADICDQSRVESLLKEQAVDTLVHFAAESHVDRSINSPDAFIKTNIEGTHSLLKAARQVWLQDKERTVPHRFHHVSTDEVYGSLKPEAPAFTESTAFAPNSPYAASKAAAAHLVRAYAHTYGLQVTSSHCSNNYGPFHFPEKFLPLLITNCLQGQPVPIYGDGAQIRDWLYVEDHCRGIERILQAGEIAASYNIGGNCEQSNWALAQRLCDSLDQRFANQTALNRRFPNAPPAKGQACRSLLTHVADRPGHDRRYAIDASKIKQQLGFEPQENIASGLERCIEWYLHNEDWWRPLLDRRQKVSW